MKYRTRDDAWQKSDLCEHHDGAIDVLVTDVALPEMEGPELAARLQEVRPEMKVLYMSGHTNPLSSGRDRVIEQRPSFRNRSRPTGLPDAA
jgi:DNA-binding NtrC family response regulator